MSASGASGMAILGDLIVEAPQRSSRSLATLSTHPPVLSCRVHVAEGDTNSKVYSTAVVDIAGFLEDEQAIASFELMADSRYYLDQEVEGRYGRCPKSRECSFLASYRADFPCELAL